MLSKASSRLIVFISIICKCRLIVKVKNTTSTDTCKKLADKYGAVAYSIDAKKGKCSVLKSVRSTTNKDGFTSQRKVSN